MKNSHAAMLSKGSPQGDLRSHFPLSNTPSLDRDIVDELEARTRFLVLCDLPPSLQDRTEFKEWSETRRRVPTEKIKYACAKSWSSSHIPSTVEAVECRIRDIIQSATVSLTCDEWTGNGCAFLGITVFAVTKTFLVHRFLLDFVELKDRKTARCLHANLVQSVEKYINPKDVIGVTADNAKAIQAALSFESSTGWIPFRCVIHTFQLSVKRLFSMDEICEVITRVKRTVHYFKVSSTALRALKAAQHSIGISDHATLRLIQSCPTRWDSTFLMLERFLVLRDHVTTAARILDVSKLKKRILDDGSVLESPSEFSSKDWCMIEEMVLLLNPFHKVTELLSRKEATLSEVPGAVFSINEFLSKPIKANESGWLQHARFILAKDVQQRLGELLQPTNIATKAAFLDPRFKSLTYLTHAQKAEFVALYTESLPVPTQRASQTQQDLPEVFKVFSSALFTESDSMERTAASIIKAYIDAPVLKLSECPYKWWGEHRKQFSSLSDNARKLFSIRPSSVDSERAFSLAGLFLLSFLRLFFVSLFFTLSVLSLALSNVTHYFFHSHFSPFSRGELWFILVFLYPSLSMSLYLLLSKVAILHYLFLHFSLFQYLSF